MSLAIKPIHEEKSDKLNIPDRLPQPPFRMILVACSNSGKTTVINNLLSHKQFGYKQLFKKNIFLFSPSAHYDTALDNLNLKEKNIREKFDQEFIDEIVQDQKEVINEHGKANAPHILFIFDDVVLEMPKTKDSPLKKLFFYGRKYKISLMITTQKYRLLDPAYRLNASHWIYFTGNINNFELNAIADDQPLDKNTFKKIWKRATEEGQYSFIYANMKEPIKQRYYITFEQRVSIK